jgi:hypothetical protein
MRLRSFGFALGALALLSPSFASASSANCPTPRVTEIETPLGCVETVVTLSHAPSGPSMADGGRMEFRDDISKSEHVRELYVYPGDSPIANAGDHVRVCLLSIPKKSAACDPAKDGRGHEFLVFDRNSEEESDNAHVYTNAEHWCGGA